MEFDATFIIAAISFIVFVFIMNKIFYAPVLNIMHKREAFIEDNYNSANETKKLVIKQTEYRENELNKSRENAREIISQQTKILQDNKSQELHNFKAECIHNLETSREEMKNSTLNAKEILKDKVVDIAKDISQVILGDFIDKEQISKSDIKEQE